MKTLRFLFVAIALCIFQVSNIYAKTNNEMVAAKKELHKSLTEVFKNIPFEDLYDENCSPVVNIYFKINEDRELEFVTAVGQNKDLVRYINIILSRERFSVPPILGEGPIRIDLKLKNVEI